jgi:hypothetical protein
MNLTDILNTVQRTKESHSNLDKTMFKTGIECLINGPICSAIFTQSCHNYNKFFEGFNDSEVNPDGIWNSGTLTIQVVAIPEPSTYAMLALAGAGFAGYVIRRRRR